MADSCLLGDRERGAIGTSRDSTDMFKKPDFFDMFSAHVRATNRCRPQANTPVKFIVRRHDIFDLRRQLGFLQDHCVDQNALV